MLRVLKGLLQVAPKNDVRNCLNGIHLASGGNGGTTLTASDGHMVAIVTMHYAEISIEKGADVIVCRHSLATILKLFKPRDTLQLKISNDSVTIGTEGGPMFDVTLVDGKYPDVTGRLARITNTTGTRCTTGISLNLMAQLAKAGATIISSKCPCTTLDVYDATSPLIFNAIFGDDAISPNELKMALMPARV